MIKPNVKIFCDGITDQIFIANCIELLFPSITVTISKRKEDSKKRMVTFGEGGEVIDVGGCANLNNEVYLEKMRDNSAERGVNLVIFDADYTEQSNGNKGVTSKSWGLSKKFFDSEEEHFVIRDTFLSSSDSFDLSIARFSRSIGTSVVEEVEYFIEVEEQGVYRCTELLC